MPNFPDSKHSTLCAMEKPGRSEELEESGTQDPFLNDVCQTGFRISKAG